MAMNPELKAYLDEWEARRRSDFADCMASLDALQRSMDITVGCVTAPVTATAELALASAGLAEPLALVPAIGEAPAIARAAPIDTFDLVPASVTMSTMTMPLLWTSRLSSSPASPATSATNNSVMVSSDTAKIVTASAGLAEPPALVPTTEKPLVVAQDVPNGTRTEATTFCSTECPSRDITEPAPAFTPSATATSPTATVEVIHVLTVAAASDRTFDDEATKGAASKVITSSSVSPYNGVSALSCAFISSATASLSTAPTAWTCTTISDTHVLQLFCVQVLGKFVPVNCSTVGLDAICLSDQVPTVQTIQSLLIFASHTIDMPLSSSWNPERMHYHTSWPPPYLHLSWIKLRPIPWPSFADLPGGVHLTEPRPSLQGTSGEFSVLVLAVIHLFPDGLSGPLHICLQYEVYCEEQFYSHGISLNLSENFLKKPCAESNKAIWNGLISRATRALKLWCIPWFSIAVPLFSGLFCVDSGVLKWSTLSLDLPRRAMGNYVEFIQSNLARWLSIVLHILKRMEKMQQLLIDVLHQEFLPSMAETSGGTFVIIRSVKNIAFLMWATTVDSDYTFQLISGHMLWSLTEIVHGLPLEVLPYGECTNLNLMLASYEKVWKIAWFFIGGCSLSDNMKMDGNEGLIIRFLRVPLLALLGSRYKLFSGGTCQARKVQSYMKLSYSDCRQQDIYFRVGHLAFYSSFPMCTVMRMEGNGELNQRLVSVLMSECFSNKIHASALSSIMQPSWSNKQGLQVVTGIFFWVPTDLDGDAYQHQYVPWDPGGGRSRASFFSRREECHKVRCLLLQVDIDHDYYKPIYNDYYNAYHEDYNKIKEVHAPLDPGKATLWNPLKLRLEDKPSFKEGGMLGPSAAFTSSWAGIMGWQYGLGPTDPSGATYTHQGEKTEYPSWIRRMARRLLSPI